MEPEAALGRLWELALLLNADMNRGLAERGLTRSRAQLVWELQRRGPVTQRALSEALQVSARNVTGLVDALVETGFVTRRPHPADRRASLIALTDAGSAAATDMEAEQRDFARTLFSDLSTYELANFTTTLDGLLARLRAAAEATDEQ